MLCPRCTASELIERNHEGVTVDVCRECRGVWLDRGELEKVIARATRDMDELAERGYARRGAPAYAPEAPGVAYRRRDDSSGDYDLRFHEDRRRRRKWYESLGDIFD